MSRLIDADALKKKLFVFDMEFHDGHHQKYYVYKEKDVDDAPTIDAVPVVRCKDCKYSSDNRVYGCRIESFDYDFDTQMYANDFCSCGKRRSNG